MKEKTLNILNKLPLIIILLLCSVGAIYSFYSLFSYAKEINDAEGLVDDLAIDNIDDYIYDVDTNGEVILPEDDYVYVSPFDDLWAENPDFVGWIYIPGTNINYPVVQTIEDEEYYIHRDFEGNYSSSGTLFCSANSSVENPSQNIIIYGHHMRSETMFGRLTYYQSEAYYQEHRYIYFFTNWWEGVYEVVGAFPTDIHEGTYPYYNFTNGTVAEFNEWVANTIDRTPYVTEGRADVHYGDQFITLSTCNYHISNGRFVVIARRVN